MSQFQAIIALVTIGIGLAGVLATVMASSKAYMLMGNIQGHWEADRTRLKRHSDGIREIDRLLAKLPADVGKIVTGVTAGLREDIVTLNRGMGELGVRMDGLARRFDEA